MKAQKVTITIVIEGLSVDIAGSMTAKAVEQIEHEFEAGELQADDGDTVRWSVKRETVTF